MVGAGVRVETDVILEVALFSRDHCVSGSGSQFCSPKIQFCRALGAYWIQAD